MFAQRLGPLASMAGAFASAQGAAAEGDVQRGRLGTGARELANVMGTERVGQQYLGFASGFSLSQGLTNVASGGLNRLPAMSAEKEAGRYLGEEGVYNAGKTASGAQASAIRGSGVGEDLQLKAIQQQALGGGQPGISPVQAAEAGCWRGQFCCDWPRRESGGWHRDLRDWQGCCGAANDRWAHKTWIMVRLNIGGDALCCYSGNQYECSRRCC